MNVETPPSTRNQVRRWRGASAEGAMTSYRFLNRDRTLVLRDDHVIAWDPTLNQPVEKQPSATPPPTSPRPPNERNEPAEVIDRRDHVGAVRTGEEIKALPPTDETKLWKDAGSPQPTALYPGAGPARAQPPAGLDDEPEQPPKVMTMTPRPDLEQFTSVAAELGQVEDALAKVNDIAGLRAQVAALTKIVRALAGAREPQPHRRRPK